MTKPFDRHTQKTQLPILKTKNQLNKLIVKTGGSPDYLAINLYWDALRSWYGKRWSIKQGQVCYTKKLKTPGIFLKYRELSQELSCSQETVRRKLVKLEELGLIQRSFQHQETGRGKSFNQLIVYVWQETPHFLSDRGLRRDGVNQIVPYTNHQYIRAKYATGFNPSRPQAAAGGDPINRPADTKELSFSCREAKSRSIKSTSCQVANGQGQPPANHQPVAKKGLAQTNRSFKEAKTLGDFHPLSQEDHEHLQLASGRAFSWRAMNEILLAMAKKIQRWFWSKKGFLSYMAQAFKHEMRDAIKVSNETFRIKANQTTQEITIDQQEEYLSSIEYSLQVSPEWHLKKKLCAVLEREKAYHLLRAYQRGSVEDGVFKMHLNKPVELSVREQAIILAQVRATHETVEMAGHGQTVARLELVLPAGPRFTRERPVTPLAGVWGKVRQALMAYYGDRGAGLDWSWFSQLLPEVDEPQHKIKLRAPNPFFRSWIINHYSQGLASCFGEYQYDYEIC